MPDPIVFDCGGSTRVKKIVAGGYGDMKSFADVQDLTPATAMPGTGPLPVGAVGSQHSENGPYTSMAIVFQDAAAIPFSVPVGPLGPFPSNVVITSNANQNVRVDFIAVAGGASLVITLYSTVSDPLIEVKQERSDLPPGAPPGAARKGKRRYIVANAGAIKTISLNGAPPVFDASNSAVAPIAAGAIGPVGGPAAPAVGVPLYVSVVLR